MESERNLRELPAGYARKRHNVREMPAGSDRQGARRALEGSPPRPAAAPRNARRWCRAYRSAFSKGLSTRTKRNRYHSGIEKVIFKPERLRITQMGTGRGVFVPEWPGKPQTGTGKGVLVPEWPGKPQMGTGKGVFVPEWPGNPKTGTGKGVIVPKWLGNPRTGTGKGVLVPECCCDVSLCRCDAYWSLSILDIPVQPEVKCTIDFCTMYHVTGNGEFTLRCVVLDTG